MNDDAELQKVPIKVYESSDRLTVAAPMPGLEPEDITIEVTQANQLLLHGGARGKLKGENRVFEDEWNPGPYCRELTLPSPVNGDMANVTYRNGILVVVLPLSDATQPAYLGLEEVGPEHGERVGNAGHPIKRLSSSEHKPTHQHLG